MRRGTTKVDLCKKDAISKKNLWAQVKLREQRGTTEEYLDSAFHPVNGEVHRLITWFTNNGSIDEVIVLRPKLVAVVDAAWSGDRIQYVHPQQPIVSSTVNTAASRPSNGNISTSHIGQRDTILGYGHKPQRTPRYGTIVASQSYFRFYQYIDVISANCNSEPLSFRIIESTENGDGSNDVIGRTPVSSMSDTDDLAQPPTPQKVLTLMTSTSKGSKVNGNTATKPSGGVGSLQKRELVISECYQVDVVCGFNGCSDAFQNVPLSVYEDHIENHFQANPNLVWKKCPVCAMSFDRKTRFVSHLATHPIIKLDGGYSLIRLVKPCKCTLLKPTGKVCAYRGATVDNVKAHVKGPKHPDVTLKET